MARTRIGGLNSRRLATLVAHKPRYVTLRKIVPTATNKVMLTEHQAQALILSKITHIGTMHDEHGDVTYFLYPTIPVTHDIHLSTDTMTDSMLDYTDPNVQVGLFFNINIAPAKGGPALAENWSRRTGTGGVYIEHDDRPASIYYIVAFKDMLGDSYRKFVEAVDRWPSELNRELLSSVRTIQGSKVYYASEVVGKEYDLIKEVLQRSFNVHCSDLCD